MPHPTTAAQLAAQLGGRLEGDDRPITTLADPTAARPGSVVVVTSAAALEALSAQGAAAHLGALVLPDTLRSPLLSCPIIRVSDARLALAHLSALFTPPPPRPHLSDKAHVAPGVTLGEAVSIGAGAVIGEGATIGAGTRVGAGCVIGEGVAVGPACVLHANVTLYPGTVLGARVILHSGAVLGADGFGYAFGPQGALKIHHLGRVILEDDVEVGANTCIDRGTLLDTRVGARTKIDNLCQIGHNAQIGPDCLIAGGSAVGGSTVLERGVILGGAVAVTDHVRLGAGARVAGRSSVTKSVPAGETWAGYPAKPQRRWVRELYLIGKLEAIWASVRAQGRPLSSARTGDD
jgi:UDP-3-O-[3-hydroxymyristoyl] glucosamine N-acyltransferase